MAASSGHGLRLPVPAWHRATYTRQAVNPVHRRCILQQSSRVWLHRPSAPGSTAIRCQAVWQVRFQETWTDSGPVCCREPILVRTHEQRMNQPAGKPNKRAPQRGEASLWSKLGPGLITGAADDDPSGIATYSQSGAAFGYGVLWTVLFTFPLMVGIQIVSAQIGRVTGHGLAANIGRHYPKPLLTAIVVLLLVANTINIAADIGAMASAT